MNIYAVTSKSILVVSILLTTSIAVSAKKSHASALDPVCQLNTPNGYCQLFSPSVKLTTLPSITPATSNAAEFGTFKRPFSVTSLWNSRPRQVAFGSVVIPTSSYYPLVGTGSYSTIAFLASSTDSAVTVYPADGKPGVWDPDSEAYYPSITIPHWPSETVPAIRHAYSHHEACNFLAQAQQEVFLEVKVSNQDCHFRVQQSTQKQRCTGHISDTQ